MVAAAIAPSVYDAKAANKKVTVIQDDITMTTLTGGNWQVKSDTKIEYRTSGGTTVKLEKRSLRRYAGQKFRRFVGVEL